MTTIIKSGDRAVAVRSLDETRRAAPGRDTPVNVEEMRLREQVAALESAARDHASELERVREEVPRAFARGEEQGRLKGLAEADERQSERLNLLDKALERAGQNVAESLSSLERLAVLLARDGLEVILGDTGARASMLAEIIRTQYARIEKGAVLGVRLSRIDFPDKASLDQLVSKVGVVGLDISASDDVPAGGCTMQLRLGEIAVGIDQQWDAVRSELEAMARSGTKP